METEKLRELTAHIVSAYVEQNRIPVANLPELVASVASSVSGLGPGIAPAAEEPTPAVNPKRSVHNEYIVCLEDGKRFRSLKRHLGTHHHMTPEEYRSKWSLAPTYPMTAPGYAEQRSALAKKMGLGRKPAAKTKIKRGKR